MEEFSNISNHSKVKYICHSHTTLFQLNLMPNTCIHPTIIAICLLFTIATAFRFTLDSDSPSLSLNFNVKGKQTFYLVSSGQQNHDVQILIDYRTPRMRASELLLNKTSNDIEFTYDYEEGYINATIISSTGTDRNVSFDFYSEDDPLVKMIDKRDIKYVESVLGSVFHGLTNISRNQQFHIERDESHKITLQESESSIKWTGIIKILFLLSSALIQLWIMKGFFKSNTHHAYQPVQSM